jgi:hypothetical protein
MSWAESAACQGMPLSVFFPDPSDLELTLRAKQVCAGCPVRSACLSYAEDTNQIYGIWGGMSEPDRRRAAGYCRNGHKKSTETTDGDGRCLTCRRASQRRQRERAAKRGAA